MHCYMVSNVLAAATGLTFGDTTSPANFELVARARRQYAKHLWYEPDIVQRAAPYLPPLKLATPPTPAEIANFQRADLDTLNTGVLGYCGRRLPPAFAHHVDDNLYADIDDNLRRGVSASAIACFELLGYPAPYHPNPLSLDKLDTHYSHLRRQLGYSVDSRSLEVCLLDHKREELLDQLSRWIGLTSFTLREAAELHGTLESASRYVRWARAFFFTLANVLRHELRRRYYPLQRWYDKSPRRARLDRTLPETLKDRLAYICDREKAQLLWNSQVPITLTPALRAELQIIHDMLSDRSNRWSGSIGHIIPRCPHIESWGDASTSGGGGAYCPRLRLWFGILWSDPIRAGCALPPGTPGYVHINGLEFIVVILQLAAIITAFELYPPHILCEIFPKGVPAEPILLAWCDNSTAETWTRKATTKSLQGQNLIKILTALYLRTPTGLNSDHIETENNRLADFISRPTSPDISPATYVSQIFQKAPHMRNWNFFHPNPELLLLLASALSSAPWVALPSLPKSLGHFVADAFTISSLPLV